MLGLNKASFLCCRGGMGDRGDEKEGEEVQVRDDDRAGKKLSRKCGVWWREGVR